MLRSVEIPDQINFFLKVKDALSAMMFSHKPAYLTTKPSDS